MSAMASLIAATNAANSFGFSRWNLIVVQVVSAVAGLPNSSFEDQILRMPGLSVTCWMNGGENRYPFTVAVWNGWAQWDPLGRSADEMSPFSFPRVN